MSTALPQASDDAETMDCGCSKNFAGEWFPCDHHRYLKEDESL